MREIIRTKHKIPILVKDEDDNVPGSTSEKKINIIEQYFKKTLAPLTMTDEFLTKYTSEDSYYRSSGQKMETPRGPPHTQVPSSLSTWQRHHWAGSGLETSNRERHYINQLWCVHTATLTWTRPSTQSIGRSCSQNYTRCSRSRRGSSSRCPYQSTSDIDLFGFGWRRMRRIPLSTRHLPRPRLALGSPLHLLDLPRCSTKRRHPRADT